MNLTGIILVSICILIAILIFGLAIHNKIYDTKTYDVQEKLDNVIIKNYRLLNNTMTITDYYMLTYQRLRDSNIDSVMVDEYFYDKYLEGDTIIKKKTRSELKYN